MVRTKAGSVSNKAIGAKAPQKVTITAILSGNAPKSKHTGGNPYHPRETPGWQKPITYFMKQDGESSKDESVEIEDLPGLPGIRGDIISPKGSGTKKKRKEQKNKERTEADDEKKVKTKKNLKKSEATDVEEKPKKNKKKDQSDSDVENKSKKRKKGGASHSKMEFDNETEDADEAVNEKENIENSKSEQRDIGVDEESAGEKKRQSDTKKNIGADSKDEEKSEVQEPEKNETQIENEYGDHNFQDYEETDEEMEEENNNGVMDLDEPAATENYNEDEASENV